MRLSVIIPVFNEAATIGQILNQVLKQKAVGEIIVVNDGSTDQTGQILQKIKNPKIKVTTYDQNQGKGHAVRVGFKKAKGKWVIVQDADLEYSPKEYTKLLAKAKGRVVVYGSRLTQYNPKAYVTTYFGNWMITKLANLLFRLNLTDSYTGYKLLPKTIIDSLQLTANGFEIEAEITAKLAKRGIEILEVPISYNPRSYEAGKKITTKDFFQGIWTYIKIWLGG